MSSNINGIYEQVAYTADPSVLLHINTESDSYPTHWHPAIEVIMPLENHYTVIMNKTTYDLKENDILFIPPGELHELKAPPTGRRLIILFDYSLVNNARGLVGILSIIHQPHYITKQTAPEVHEQIRKLLVTIMEEYRSDRYLWETAIYAKLIELLLIIGRKYMNTSTIFPDANRNKQREYVEKFDLIFDYIRKNYAQDISLDAIANVAGFSKFHFSRLFKQFTNMSFYDYLNKQRIQAAESLLLEPNLPITEVAFQSGFSSISTFNRVFKTIKECTPTEFRTLYSRQFRY